MIAKNAIAVDRLSGGRPELGVGCCAYAAQVDELRARGSRVETIFPDGNSEHMFVANAMDLSMRPAVVTLRRPDTSRQ